MMSFFLDKAIRPIFLIINKTSYTLSRFFDKTMLFYRRYQTTDKIVKEVVKKHQAETEYAIQILPKSTINILLFLLYFIFAMIAMFGIAIYLTVYFNLYNTVYYVFGIFAIAFLLFILLNLVDSSKTQEYIQKKGHACCLNLFLFSSVALIFWIFLNGGGVVSIFIYITWAYAMIISNLFFLIKYDDTLYLSIIKNKKIYFLLKKEHNKEI